MTPPTVLVVLLLVTLSTLFLVYLSKQAEVEDLRASIEASRFAAATNRHDYKFLRETLSNYAAILDEREVFLARALDMVEGAAGDGSGLGNGPDWDAWKADVKFHLIQYGVLDDDRL